MKILYFDCFSGISGDMALGALLDTGLDRDKFLLELSKLNLEGYEIIIQKVNKNGITGTDVKVNVFGIPEYEHDHNNNHHEHDNSHDHDHTHEHVHDHGNDDRHHSQPQRNLTDIEKIINQSNLKQDVKSFAVKVFRLIAAAEGKVHGKPAEEVHFHEVGAVDSIVDIVGVAIALDMIGADAFYSSALCEGHGFIKSQHGIIPVPVPAVAEMLAGSDIPVTSLDINTELVTPTGLGIIKSLVRSFGKMPPVKVQKVGYGMGKRDTGRLNALRVIIGEYLYTENLNENILLLETNIDNMTPEHVSYIMEKLFDKGALDVYLTPIQMKKGRQAVILSVMAALDKEDEFVDYIMKNTTTLGIRRNVVERYCLDRRVQNIDTEYGKVRIKIAQKDDFVKYAPEYEDLKEISSKTGKSISDIYIDVMARAKMVI